MSGNGTRRRASARHRMRAIVAPRLRRVGRVYDDPADDPPRERLLYEGAEHVTDSELVSLVLGTGTRRHPVGVVAEGLLRSVGGLVPLARASPHELMGMSGVGEAQAARLVAALHLGRRAIERAVVRPQPIGSPEAVWRRLRPRMVGMTQEVFIVIAMNARGVVIEDYEIGRGTLARVDVHPRDVFRMLIRVAAAFAIVAHNHPSGDPTPSQQDIDLTYRLKDCGYLVGIPIVDHIIVTDHSYRSLNEHLGTDAEAPLELPE
jgi:DNA repair protein RadC